MPTLEQALNELNRPSKKVKFGFSTSEDAVTWTVFQAIAGAQLLGTVVCKATGKEPSSEVSMLLWGVQQPISSATSLVRNEIVDALMALSESRKAFSEPDVVVSCTTLYNWLREGRIPEPQRNPLTKYRLWTVKDVELIRNTITAGEPE